ncbi:MAG TPA: beta-ketoacyl-ACP synthase [Rhodospirillales bacterium]|nr:beta-ketoacyl-ACP synthase [Rhodospirillales bacterium]
MSERVVVTGMAGLCPLGMDWPTVKSGLQSLKSAIKVFDDWGKVKGLSTRLGAPVEGFSIPSNYPRKKIRSMGRVSLLAARATELAIENSGLTQDEISNPRTGLVYGSTYPSPAEMGQVASRLIGGSMEGLSGSEYLKTMSHTCVINLGQFFHILGRVIPVCSACTSGSQSIGVAYEAIKYGNQSVMLAGGADELHFAAAAVFNIMFATSTRNNEPTKTPRPFDINRDGLVVGEGASTLVLESLSHAKKRDANILGELIGFASCCDGEHVVSPSANGMKQVMSLALENAQISAGQVGYINAHATGTKAGDIAESLAMSACLGNQTPISSLKSYMGHTLGACGALEAWICLHCLNEGWLPPTINLDQIDPDCAPLNYLTKITEKQVDIIMSNNFAFGGINTSLMFKKF